MMEDPKLEKPDGFPWDRDLAIASEARDAITRAKQRSPRRVLGDELIRDLAAKLEQHRKKDRRVVTPARLALAMRNVVNMAADYTNGSTATVDTTVGLFEQSPNRKAVPAANAGTARRARKKLASAKELLDQLEELLKADEIAAFCTPSEEVLASVHTELTRLEDSVRVPTGLRRGRPPLLHLVQLVHGVLHRLTGSRLRFRQNDERGDRFLADTLHRICKPLIGNEFTDEDLGQTIETAIRSPMGRQKSGA